MALLQALFGLVFFTLILALLVWGCLALLKGLSRALTPAPPASDLSQDPLLLRLESRLRDLEQRLWTLETRLAERAAPLTDQPGADQQRLQSAAAQPRTDPAAHLSTPAGPAPPRRADPLLPAPGHSAAHAPRPPAPAQPPPSLRAGGQRQDATTPVRANGPPQWWLKLRSHWSENWTGILGTAAVVAGVTFVAIHLALRLDAVQRFVLVSLVAAGMVVPSLSIGRRERWRDLSDWMRSGGAALFLFACTAAGGLPQLGLQWIAAPGPALALLSLGLALNLLAAAAARTQTVASLHVVLALIPLAISPQSWQTLLLASSVTVIGELLPGARRWDRHRLVVGCTYALFQATWALRHADALSAQPQLRDAAGLLGLLVFMAAVLLDHRPQRLAAQLAPLQLVLGLSNWGWLAIGLLIYPRQAASRALALALAAGTALLLAHRCRHSPARWLQRSDWLVAQALAMGAVFSLLPVLSDPPLLVALLLAECLLFLALAVWEGEAWIQRVGWWLTAVTATLLAWICLLFPADPIQASRLLILAALALPLTAVALRRRRLALGPSPLFGWLAGLLVTIGAAILPPSPWQAWISLAAMGGLLLLSIALRPAGLRGGLCMAVLVLHLQQWLVLLLSQPWPAGALLGRGLPLLVLAGLVIVAGRDGWWSPASPAATASTVTASTVTASAATDRQAVSEATALAAIPATDPFLRALGIHLLGGNLLLGSYLLVQPLSPLAVGVVWLLLALFSLELADRLPPADAGQVLALGLLALAAFAANYLLVISQSPANLQLAGQTLRGRLLIELFAIAVALYFWCFNGLRSLHRSSLWRRVHPWFLEACLVGIAVTILSEIPTLWRPVLWSLLALSLLSRPLRVLFAARVQVYAVIVHWLAVATLLTNLGTLNSPAGHWSQQPETIALLAIAAQVGFIVASHRWLRRDDLGQPGGPPLLGWIGVRVAGRPHRWLDIPVFVAVAVFLAIRYDQALLTLLWALEAFVIYGLGAVLRDGSFRYLALAAMGACLLRLVSVDLAQADLGLRGLVFIGVGLLMLGMNTIYTRFWSESR